MANPKIVAKIESEEPLHRLAVLIDADNAQAAIIEGLGRVYDLGEGVRGKKESKLSFTQDKRK
jgi:hypothetical protein